MRPLYDSCVLESTQAAGDTHSDTDSKNNVAMVPTLRQLVRQVGGSVKCNLGSTVAGATRLIAGASGTALDTGVCFPGEFSVMASTFALG